ncbi:MAG: hypothetical protein NT158_11810 [Cyanobacteria bacterium]|nr:hypothetical protein [Cyanobacteriota bacterium]
MRTIKLAIMIGGAAYLLSSTGPSLAQSADIDADLRCAAISMLVNSNKDPKVREGGRYMVAYFMGKLIGRDPNLLNVKSALESAVEKFTQRASVAEMEQGADRCVKEMGTALKTIRDGVIP